MTRPTLPGLVAELMAEAEFRERVQGASTMHIQALKRIAAELSQAVALSDAEKEAWGALNLHANGITPMSESEAKLIDTLLARLTAASDGGGKGEEDGK